MHHKLAYEKNAYSYRLSKTTTIRRISYTNIIQCHHKYYKNRYNDIDLYTKNKLRRDTFRKKRISQLQIHC